MGQRRKSRIYALQALYMYETVECSIDELCSLKWIDKEVSGEIRDFAVSMIKGSLDKLDQIDELIKKYAKNWEFERISSVDKAILRISIYTLLNLSDIPIAVTINEGVELGKIYGGEASGQFINGILDTIKKSELKNGGKSKS